MQPSTTNRLLLVIIVPAVVVLLSNLYILHAARGKEAYVYAPDGTVVANWRYTQMPMVECSWCGSKVSLQRHHVTPWSAMPELENEPTNIVVLCQPDHFRVAHGGNWKRFNANLLETLKTPKWVNSNEFYKETHEGREREETRK